jgi:ERCC4-type nuclease
MVEISIDSKEPISYKVKALESGDYEFRVNGSLVRIERKNYNDLLNSFQSGRLAVQLNQLKADCNFPFIAIIGYPNMFNFLEREAMRNMLLSIKLAGILIERLDNQKDYENRLTELVKYFNNETHYNLIPYRYSNPKLSALMFVPGIGFKTAKKLLDTWQDSLIDIYNAPKPALEKIIGSVLADRFYNAIRKPVKKVAKEDYALWD